MNTTFEERFAPFTVQPQGVNGRKSRQRRAVMTRITNLVPEDQDGEDQMIELFGQLEDLAAKTVKPDKIEMFLMALATGTMTLPVMTRGEAETLAQTMANFLTVPVHVKFDRRWTVYIQDHMLIRN